MNYKKKFFSVFIFILLISFAIYLLLASLEMAINKQVVYLNHGFIDITDCEFNKNLIQLKGDWDTSQNNNSYITYKATIKKPSNLSSIGIKIPTVVGCYSVFVNNTKLEATNHLYSYDSNHFNVSKYYFFETEQDYFELVINFYKHDLKKPYIAGSIVIGSETNMYIYKQISITILVLGCTILLVFSMILFFIYLINIKTEKLIFLSTFAIFVFIKILLLHTNFAKFPSLKLDDIYSFKLIICTSLLSVFYLHLYFVNIYNRTCKIVNYTIITCVITSTIYTMISFNYTNLFIITNLLSSLMYFCILLSSTISLLKNKKDSFLNFIFAIFLLIFMIVNVSKNGFLLHVDYTAIVFMVILIVKFTLKQLIYNKKNLLLKYNLEKEVKLRTIDLIKKNLDLDKEKHARLIAEENLKNASNYSIQTGLFNYTYSLTYIGDLINIFQRYNHIFSIILIEVNNLNFINETFGPELKAEILNETIRIIRLVIRRTDLLTSWHDDKFMIIIPNGTKKSSINIVNKLIQLIENNLINGYGNITINFGIATIEPNDRTETIINRAECQLKNAIK